MKLNKKTLSVLIAALGLAILPIQVRAFDIFEGCTGSEICEGGDLPGFIKICIDTLLYVLVAVAVIMIIVGGVQYITSAGDTNSTNKARDTVVYSVIGLVVAICSIAIVNFVIDRFL